MSPEYKKFGHVPKQLRRRIKRALKGGKFQELFQGGFVFTTGDGRITQIKPKEEATEEERRKAGKQLSNIYIVGGAFNSKRRTENLRIRHGDYTLGDLPLKKGHREEYRGNHRGVTIGVLALGPVCVK